MIAPALHRGQIVVIDFGPRAKMRPALIVQNDRDNARMTNTIVVQITSNLTRAHEQTQLLIDLQHPDWQMSGLHRPSVISCSTVGYISQRHVIRRVGELSAETMLQINDCLRIALDLK